MEGKHVLSVPMKLPKSTARKSLQKKKSIRRVGTTDHFTIDYDDSESMILLYGKEAPSSHGVKLGLSEDETSDIIKKLRQAKLLFHR